LEQDLILVLVCGECKFIDMKYSDINIGDHQELSHTITKEDIEKFVDLTGDDNKLHVDEEFAGKTYFKRPVVHGMLGASFISTIIGTKLPGDGALWFSQTLDFLLPVRVGDKLNVVAQVIGKNDKEQYIELKTEIFNQNRQVVTKGISKVKIIDQDEAVSNEEVKEENARVKTALIIGATGGIGSEVCRQLASDGFNVIIHYHRNHKLAMALKHGVDKLNRKALVIKADISNDDDIKPMIEKSLRFSNTIDVIVNCAATTIPNIKVTDLVWKDFLNQIELNIKSTFAIIKEVLPYMIERGYGKIINIGSYSADKPNSEWAHYITAKSALEGLTKALAFELAPKGIFVNMVTPSLINTELTADIPEKFKLLSAAQTPLRRLANVTDVAGAISFFASDKSNFITGQNIRINGGQVML
jgi:3-oxoacyl-[acyl-carrier protein] reductase